MAKAKYFGLKINEDLLKRFLEKVYKDYHHGKIREVIEDLLREYIDKIK